MTKPKNVKFKKQIKKKKRNYTLKHSQEMIDVAVGLLKVKKMSSYEAEKTFGIPQRTLLDKLHGKHQRTPGCPTRLTIDKLMEEQLFLITIYQGKTLKGAELRNTLEKYLTISIICNNL